jgi:hypothetical protein
VLFLTASLQSKWGFDDGHVLTPLVEDNFPEVEARFNYEVEHDIPFRESYGLNFFDDLLEIIVRKYILPRIPNSITLKRVVGHNPVRAATIDGELVDDYRYPPVKALEPDYIEVHETAIIEEGTKLWQDRLARMQDFPRQGT